MSILYLRETDVDRLLTMACTIQVMDEAFRSLAAGKADNAPRERVRAPGIVLHSMSAALADRQLVGWKQYTTTAQGARFLVGLHDQDSGELTALIEANRLGQLRTGAVTGLAVRHLAAEDADQVGMFGCGWQAESQLAAVANVRSLRRAFVFSRDPQRRKQFAEKMAAQLNIDVVACDEPDQAVEDHPIVITATTSSEPVFDGTKLAAGAVVCAVGSNWLKKSELDAEVFRRARLVVCDNVACCRKEAGDLDRAQQAGVFAWDDAKELADVVTGKTARDNDQDIIVFKSVGMALEDVAIGGKLLELAQQHGVGSVLEIDE
jgi:ornithine cyclodeaminase/alanine dehydrogenase-like protein (mu-crystallin family)